MDGSGRRGDLRFLAAASREDLATVVGESCNLDLLIEDSRAELADRPYNLVAVAGGWQHPTPVASPAPTGPVR